MAIIGGSHVEPLCALFKKYKKEINGLMIESGNPSCIFRFCT